MGKSNHLVIVESPSKAKTIGKYLGPDYVVKASMGHLRDLPKSRMGVDLEHGFTPEYIPVRGKEALIKELKAAAAQADTVYLATDPDREGEAISWHLKELLKLPEEKTHRVTFHEITQKVVKDSIQHPRDIDYDLVDAQQARRILDRIVGYELSPLLWKKIRRGLSAGRVQSVATRMVVDREEEIRAFQPKEYWTLDVTLNRMQKPGSFVAHYYGEEKKRELQNEAETQAIIDDITGKPFTVTNVKKAEKKRSAAPPFTTSTLQQEASRKLNMTPKKTMMIAQQLYEGVDVEGEGTLGLITYYANYRSIAIGSRWGRTTASGSASSTLSSCPPRRKSASKAASRDDFSCKVASCGKGCSASFFAASHCASASRMTSCTRNASFSKPAS